MEVVVAKMELETLPESGYNLPDDSKDKEEQRSFSVSPDNQNSSSTTGATEELDVATAQRQFSGWRLIVITFTMLLGLFLATVETSITATALVSIGEYFNDSLRTTWVVLSYLLSYMGFSVIFARLSDGIGRKNSTIIAWILFSGFSFASGLAQSLNQLIVFRALQGIGGSGLYSLTMIVIADIFPAKRLGLMSGLIGMSFACSSVVGPLLGGVITQNSTWRWIYLFNAPAAAFGITALLVAWPESPKGMAKSKGVAILLSQVDVPGGILLLAASTLLVFALQEAGTRRYSWNSPTIIICLVVSGVCWCVFTTWISWLDYGQSRKQMKPIFPTSVALKRPTGPTILMSFMTGFPYYVVIINLPLQFQIVNGDTPTMAGVHLLPVLAALALGTTIGGGISSKKNLTSYCLIAASCLILLGCGLLSTISSSHNISSSQYVYQLILGLGFGLSFSSLTLAAAFSNTPQTVASAQGAISQARILGGNIGLVVATIIFNQRIDTDLSGTLNSIQLDALRQSLSTVSFLDPSQQAAVGEAFSKSFNDQVRICTYLSAVAVVVALFTWQRHPPNFKENETRQAALAESHVE